MASTKSTLSAVKASMARCTSARFQVMPVKVTSAHLAASSAIQAASASLRSL